MCRCIFPLTFAEVELGTSTVKNLANRQHLYRKNLFVGFFFIMHFSLFLPMWRLKNRSLPKGLQGKG